MQSRIRQSYKNPYYQLIYLLSQFTTNNKCKYKFCASIATCSFSNMCSYNAVIVPKIVAKTRTLAGKRASRIMLHLKGKQMTHNVQHLVSLTTSINVKVLYYIVYDLKMFGKEQIVNTLFSTTKLSVCNYCVSVFPFISVYLMNLFIADTSHDVLRRQVPLPQ